jgi:gliding motility-associated-like protein
MESKNPESTTIKYPKSIVQYLFFKSYVSASTFVKYLSSEMKSVFRFLSLFILFFTGSVIALSQVDGDYQTRNIGNWSDNTTWQVRTSGAWVDCLPGDYPGASAGAGTAYITGNSTVTVTANVPNAVGALIFVGENGSNLVQFSGSYSLNITGAITINPPTGGTNNNGILVESGTVTCSSVASLNSGNNLRDCKVGISDGSLTVSGNITMGSNQNQNDITFSGAGTLNVTGDLTTGRMVCVAGSTVNIGGTLTLTSFTVGNSTINFNGSDQNIPSYPASYYNLAASGSGTKTLPNTNVTVAGTLTVNNSTLAYNSTTGRTLSVAGDLSGNGTIDMSPGNLTHTLNLAGTNNSVGTLVTGTAASLVNYNYAGDQFIFPSTAYRNLTVSNGGYKTLGGDITVSGTLTFSTNYSKIVLGTNDLTLTGTSAVGGINTTRYIIANDIGEFKKVFAAGATAAYYLPVGDSSNYSPVRITFTANSVQRTIGVRVTDMQHPDDGTATDFISRYWSFSDDQAGTYTYNADFYYIDPDDIVGTEGNIKVNMWDGAVWTQYNTGGGRPPITITAVTETTAPLNNNEFTGRINPSRTYFWNQSGSTADWTVPSNWTPARLSPQTNDILIFDNNGTTTATNVQTQTIERLVISNGSSVTFEAAAARTLTINNAIGTELDVNSGTSLTLGTNVNLTLAAAATATIDGTLTVDPGRTYITNGAGTLTTVTGTLVNSGAVTSTATGLIFTSGSTYEHFRDGGTIPTATWDAVSNCSLTGLAATTPGGLNQTFGNFNYNSPYTMPLGGNLTITGNLDISMGAINGQTRTINLSGNLTGTADLIFSSGTLNIAGDFSNTGTFTYGTTSTVNYNGTAQQVKGTTYYNLSINGGDVKTLAGPTQVNGNLTLTSGVLQLGDYDVTQANVLAIGGSPFSLSNMIETNGAGRYIRSATANNLSFNQTYPVGSGGYYNPFIITGLPNLAGAARTISVGAVPADPGVLTNTLNKYWDISVTNITPGPVTVLSFQYNAGEIIGDPLLFQPYTNGSGSWALATGPSAPGSNPATSTGSATITGYWTVGSPSTFYSYQTGYWDQSSTWTFDPGGTTGPGTLVPGQNDKVVILSGRTVSLQNDDFTQNLDITINSGGIIDQGTFGFLSPLAALRGGGTLKLASSSFPSASINTFVTTDGGTTEYNVDGQMSVTQTTYYHLTINTTGTVTLVNNVTLNGNLNVDQGTFRINDATPRRLSMVISGNVTVDNTGLITVGTGGTRTSAGPIPSITGSSGGFLNYYELNSHRVQVYGDFTNNGSVKFTGLVNPVYNTFPNTGFASVYFQGSSDNILTCNGTTDLYNLIIDKGTDQTYKLTVYSSAYNYFRLFGANTSDGSVTLPAAPAGNPNLKKALWIKNGTLVLQGLVVIPSLSEGVTAGSYPSDFFIPSNGAMQLDGAGVIVLATADDYTEVNAAYGLAGGSNAAYGINILGGYSAISILGKLQVNNGYLSTRESSGLLYWSYAPGQFILNGGKVDTKQLHNPEGGATGLISYSQSAGTMIVRGRFKNNILYSVPSDLANTTINTARISNGIDPAAGIGSFSINSNAANAYSMSGGTLSVYDVCNTTATPLAFLVNCPVSNINVSGGTVQLLPTTGTVLPDANYLINSTAQMYNLVINRASGAASVQLNTNPLVTLNNLSLTSGVFITNNLDVTVGGDFTISSGTTYTPGTNTTIFNGSAAQSLTVDLAAPLSLNKLTVDKPSGIALNLTGTQGQINVLSDLRIVLATMNDNGKIMNVTGNVYNSGIHTGAGRIVLNGPASQVIDGGGTFNNLELNNNSAAAAPVSLAANCTINGSLTLSQNKLFDIGTFNLRLNAGATLVNGGPLRYIKSAGNAGDGGLTKVYTTPAAFNFPIGVVNYTPASIGLSGAPTAYGSITVIPVNFAHPNVTAPGRCLTYFWRTKSSGFTLGPATVTHGYTYSQTNVVTGGDVSEDEYVAARFDVTTSSWSRGNVSDVDETANIIGEPGAGSFLENVTFIDGDYTAGDDNPTNPFGVPQIFYSRINGAGAGSGLWSNVNTWSTDPVLKHTGAPAASVPGASDIVVIGGLDSVYLATDVIWPYTTANVDPRSCASLKIEKGSALDIGYNPASSFGMVLNHPSGNGNFRLTTSSNDGSVYQFPSGDFSDFNVNRGTTEFYTTNPNIGPVFILPPNITSYGTVILSPLGGSNLALPNVTGGSVIIYGDLICRGQTWESWLAMSWNGAYGVINPKTVYVKGNLLLQGGSFVFAFNGVISQNIVIDGNVVVNPGAGLDIYSSRNNMMSIGGSLINNSDNSGPAIYGGFAGSNVRFRRDANNYADVTFFGPNSAAITNNTGISASPNTTFNNVIINKGTSTATSLTIDITGTLTTLTNNWLTLQNGRLDYMRTDPNTDFTISTTTLFSIPATAGLYINLPSNTGNRNILIGNANNNNGDLLLSGSLTIVNGNVYVGRTPGTDNINNDIEYTSSGASSIDVQGGLLQVNGQIRRNPLNAGGILKYSQSGGTVKVNGQASNTTNAKLEVLNAGSNFTMTNGTLTIVRGNGATVTPSTPFGDLYIRPETGSVTGGTIDFAHTGINAPQNYFLDANIPLNNITITGLTVANYSTVRLLTSPLVVNGDMTINTYSVLNSNNINITFNGNLINTPGTSGYVYGTNLTTFSASTGGPYSGIQTITGATDFYDLVVNPGISLTLSNPSTVNRNLTLSTGTFILSANPVTLLGDLVNNAGYTDDNSVGSGIILNGTILQHITGAGAYNRLTLNNAAGARVENSLTLQEDLTMTTGILDIKKYLLTLGVNALIQGGPFGATKMITSDGVFSNVGLRKFFNPGATAFLYPIGTSGKYTPGLLTITASSTVGFVRINNINSRHPAVIDPANALDYYWEVQSSGITGFTGNLVLNYMQTSVVGDEPNYLAARLIVPGTSWSLTAGVDPLLNTITTNYILSNNLSGEYTAGIASAFPTNVPTYTSNADGNWTDPSIWTQTAGDPYPCPAGGPNGFIVIINHEVTLDANYCSAYRATINNKLKVPATHYGHNLGTVYGSGTLYLEIGSFPAGVYTAFLGCSNPSTVEYGGTGTYTIIPDLYDNISNVIFSGTGTRVLPNVDLTICNRLVIDGPTLDNSVNNKKLIIKGTMERYNTGAFKAGTGANATVSFQGTTLQTLGGSLGDFTGTNAFNNLDINNSAGLKIDDAGAIDVKGNLLLTNGLINTGTSRKLTIINTNINCVVPAGGSATSFVDGPLIKMISQYDNFLFPIGKSGPPDILGNKIKLSSTQTGPLLWSAEYITPNTTAANVTAPLMGVSSQEYYKVVVTAGSQSILNIKWTPTSDVTPIITGGMSNIRLANYNTGFSSWVEIPTTCAGDDYNGTATSIGVVTSTGSDDYTLGSITDLKPRAKLNPTGPVCGASGIPVSFTAPYPIPFNYTLYYQLDGVPQVPVTVTAVPYTLPTPTPGVYKLTDFTYDNGTKVGVVDATPVIAYADPTPAWAGMDQTLCGITTTNLDADPAVVGTGLWSIVSGTGGTIITPSDSLSQFIGLNGSSYTLKWTITNGTCTSSDNVIINFTILPDPPAAVSPQDFCGVPRTIADLVATPPVGCTVDWYSAASGGVLLPPATVLVSGTTYYAESNGGTGCVSSSRTPVLVHVYALPVPGLTGPNIVCAGSTGNTYNTESGMSNYVWNVVGGFITSGGLGTSDFAVVTWNVAGPGTISVNYKDTNGCTGASPAVYNVTVNDEPTITLGTNPSVCSGATTANLTYTATTGSPNRYGIDYDATAESAGFVDIPLTTTLTASPISLIVPGGAPAGTYLGNLTVKNNITNCVSGTYPISITIVTVPTITLGSNPSVCSGATGADLTYSSATGSPDKYSIVYSAAAIAAGFVNVTNAALPASPISLVVPGAAPAAIYTGDLTVTNSTTGCVSGAYAISVTVNALPVPTFTTQPGANTCAGSSVTYTTQAGMSNYTWVVPGVSGTDYNITAGGIGATDNTVTLTWLTTGGKTVTVNYTDLNGCTGASSASNTTTVNALPTVTLGVNPSVCSGATTANLMYSATTGSPDQYNIVYNAAALAAGFVNVTNAALPASPISLIVPGAAPAATYTGDLTVTNSTTGCESNTYAISVTINADNTVSTPSSTPTLCINTVLIPITHTTTGATGISNDGVDGANGLPTGVSSTWALNTITISGTPTANGVFNYSIPLTGGCGSVNAIGTITVNPQDTVKVTLTVDKNPVCEDDTVTLTATPYNGGINPSYQWQVNGINAGTNSDTYSYVPVNNDVITVILTSDAACVTGNPATSTPLTITVNSLPSGATTVTDVACFNGTTGSVNLTVSGGAAPYTFLWSNGNTTEDLSNVAAGTYSVTITDTNLCTATVSDTVSEPATALSGAITSQTDVSVYGGNDGSVTVEGSGGTPPCQFSIDATNYQASGTFNALTANTYTVTVQDANLCTFDVYVTINQPALPLSGTITSQTNVLCYGENSGSVTVSGVGGTTPYEYSLDGNPYRASGTFDSLYVGTYTVTVRDASMTTYDVPVTITEPASALTVSTTQTDLLCYGTSTGTATATAAGGTPTYSYSWNSSPVQTTDAATGLSAGTYTVTVTDANGCIETSDVTITGPPALTVTISGVNVMCNAGSDGSATAVASGGTPPYNFSWDTSPVQTGATVTGLAAGSYTVTVTDAQGCTTTGSVQITEPAALTLDATPSPASCPDSPDGSITLNITGGTSPYSVIWADGITTQNRTGLLPNTYSVVVTDANGCAASLDVDVDYAGSYSCLVIPEIITPNGDGHNDEWIIKNIDIYPDAEIKVYNRWGRMVYNGKNLLSNPWDGTYRGKPVPTDSYHYILYLNDGSEPRSGVISVLRDESR